jgi:ATP-dependent DNA helicase UvrD/PcrA
MRLPAESQLTTEQKEVCFAPSTGTTLIVGPPGSGKTVVAHFRAQRLRNRRQKVRLLMYNHVLRRYTGEAETFLKWIGSWWREATGRGFPSASIEQDGRYRRVWDFRGALRAVRDLDRERLVSRGHWGHAILDEAQDFDRDAHRLLSVIQNVVFAEESKPPSLMILADENQRITDSNSTIKEIEEAHLLSKNDCYSLKRNYRNTREIAELARHFYVGTRSGMPELPNARGDRPVLVRTDSLNQVVERIANFARLNSQQEIGVLVYQEKTRRQLYNRLSSRLDKDGTRVQTYRAKERELADLLEFDAPGVTVLCFASSKGLEFDSVFLPELQTLPVGADHNDLTRMRLYVMCSRARSRLTLMLTEGEGRSPVTGLLPQDSTLLEEES